MTLSIKNDFFQNSKNVKINANERPFVFIHAVCLKRIFRFSQIIFLSSNFHIMEVYFKLKLCYYDYVVKIALSNAQNMVLKLVSPTRDF
jgi:hypothetical protein